MSGERPDNLPWGLRRDAPGAPSGGARKLPASGPSITIEQYETLQPRVRVPVGGKSLVFNTPNRATVEWARILLTERADVTSWLDRLEADDVLLDVGAGIGVYAIYAAAVRGARVFAFEPEGQNFALLNRNIQSNDLGARIVAFPVALSERNALDLLYLSDSGPGAHGHAFAAEVGADLRPSAAAFTQGAMGITLDEAARSGALEAPRFVRIDVGGGAHRVLAGAGATLADPAVESLLVALDPALDEHREAVAALAETGFAPEDAAGGTEGDIRRMVYARAPAAAARADEARTVEEPAAPAFLAAGKSIGEPRVDFVAARNLSLPSGAGTRAVLHHVTEAVAAAPVMTDPFPHVIVDDVMPEAYFAELVKNFPDEAAFVSSAESVITPGLYEERLRLLFDDESLAKLDKEKRAFWLGFGQWIYSELFIGAILSKFAEELEPRFARICSGGSPLAVRSDCAIVSDRTNYAIGPHTDHPLGLVSLLLYVPADGSLKPYGTSLYRHKDPDYRAWHKHHGFADFERVKTLDFLPNRLVAFPKTDRCFHGVEKITAPGLDRRLVLNNIVVLNPVGSWDEPAASEG